MTRGGTLPASNTQALASCIQNVILILLGLPRYSRNHFCCPMKVRQYSEERKQNDYGNNAIGL